MMPEGISKLIDSLPLAATVFLGAMIGLQAMAFIAWMVMMRNEISNKEKETQS